MIDLRSDTVTLPTTEMKNFMLNAGLGDDVYREDPSINILEKKASLLFGKEAALFVPSGTMANLISVLSQCNRGEEVLLGHKSHIFVYEAGGISAFGGIHSHQLLNNEDGKIDCEIIKNNIRDANDEHLPQTALLCLENTHNLCHGYPIELEYFNTIDSIIKDYNIKLHIDGARIFNAAIALNTSVKKLAQYASSITCCLSKGLSCPAGSLIMGNVNLIKKARRLRKGLGGGMRQAGILASAGIFALDNMVNRLHKDHENALIIAKELNKIEQLIIDVKKIKTNIIYFHLNTKNLSDKKFLYLLNKNNIKIDFKGRRKFRITTHFGFTKNDINKVVDSINLILKNKG